MDDFKFYGIPLAGVSVSMLKLLNPYMEFTVLFFSIISILLKIYWDYKKSKWNTLNITSLIRPM